MKRIILIFCVMAGYAMNLVAGKNPINELDFQILPLLQEEYTTEEDIFIRVRILNRNPFSVRLLKPYDKKGNSLHTFVFGCYAKNYETGAFFPQPKNLNPEQLEYIEIQPNQQATFLFHLNKLLYHPFVPGKYKISLEYRNFLGNDCIQGSVTAKNKISLVIKAAPEDVQEPDFISKKDALDIALKKNNIRYDKSQKIEVFLKKGIYRVTFPSKQVPLRRGGDFAVQYEIDARTGKILQIILSP